MKNSVQGHGFQKTLKISKTANLLNFIDFLLIIKATCLDEFLKSERHKFRFSLDVAFLEKKALPQVKKCG